MGCSCDVFFVLGCSCEVAIATEYKKRGQDYVSLAQEFLLVKLRYLVPQRRAPSANADFVADRYKVSPSR